MMEEIWKDIAGYEGKYQVSNLGRVYRLAYTFQRRNRWRLTDCVIKPGLVSARITRGYYQVKLRDSYGHRKAYQVHRLVAQAFIPNPSNLPQINHKDENKLNNVVANLEWCTAKENIRYGTCIERRAKKRGKKIAKYDVQGNFICTYDSVSKAARAVGRSCRTILDVARHRGSRHTAAGFIWKYAE